MRILIVSIAPLFPDFVMGGSQRILQDVAVGLSKAGHGVKVLCSNRPENKSGFFLAPNVYVDPCLQLKGTFPAPYETAPHRLMNTWRSIQFAAQDVDRVYLHADSVYMRDALKNLPVIRSLHDFVYEESLVSAFTMSADLTIVPSEYLRKCILETAGKVKPIGPIHVIPNGVEGLTHNSTNRFLLTDVAPKAEEDVVLLSPHRPDPRKGFNESVEVAVRLQSELPGKNIRLMVPLYPDDLPLDESASMSDLLKYKTNISEHLDIVETHRWIPTENMAAYYSFGDVTLSLGSSVESFGLVPVESIAAGTPAICANVGALRDLTLMDGLTVIPYGHTDIAVQVIKKILRNRPDRKKISEKALAIFSKESMIDQYVDSITGSLKSAEGTLIPRPNIISSDKYSGYKLAPWCNIDHNRIYHDFKYRYMEFGRLTSILKQNKWIPVGNEFEFLKSEIEEAVSEGVLIPIES